MFIGCYNNRTFMEACYVGCYVTHTETARLIRDSADIMEIALSTCCAY